jgi:hypothetical protein
MQLELKTTVRHGIEIFVPIVVFQGKTYSTNFMSFGQAYAWLVKTSDKLHQTTKI